MDLDSVSLNAPHIFENILKGLGALDLCRCACVNKLWNQVATAELNKRKKVVYFYKGSNWSLQRRASIAECSMKNSGRFEEELDMLIRNLEIKPAFCIAFANLTFLECFESLFPSHPVSKPKCKKFKKAYDDTSRQKYLESVTITALKKRLPSSCQVGLYLGHHIIDIHNERAPNRVMGRKQAPAISGYFFPVLSQPIMRFYKMRNYNQEIYRTISTHDNLKCVLALVEHKSVAYFALGLKQLQQKFDVYENGIVFPVEVGSGLVPMFFGPGVQTACFPFPFTDNQHKVVEEMHREDTIAFMFSKYYNTTLVSWKQFHKRYPLIPVVGLWGCSEDDFESTNEDQFYNRLIKEEVKFNFICKCILISIKY